MNYMGTAMFARVSPASAPPQQTQLGESWRAKYPDFPGTKPQSLDRQLSLALQTANVKCYPLGEQKCFAPAASLPYSDKPKVEALRVAH